MSKNNGKRIGGGPNGPAMKIIPNFAPSSVVRTPQGKIVPTKNQVLSRDVSGKNTRMSRS